MSWICQSHSSHLISIHPDYSQANKTRMSRINIFFINFKYNLRQYGRKGDLVIE